MSGRHTYRALRLIRRAERLALKLSRAALSQVADITTAALGKIEATRGVVRLTEASDRVLTRFGP